MQPAVLQVVVACDSKPSNDHGQSAHWQQQHHHHHHHQQPSPQQQQQQLLQQHWLQAEGMQHRVNALAAYIDSMARSSAQAAAVRHEATWHECQRLGALAQQQAAQLQQQAAELQVLRGLGGQQPGAAPHGSSGASSFDTRLQQHLDFQKAEIAAWYLKFRNEQQGRKVATAALEEALVVVGHLERECAIISAMLGDVMTVEASSAAPAPKRRWGLKLAERSWQLLVLEVLLIIVLAGCAGVASAFITMATRG